MFAGYHLPGTVEGDTVYTQLSLTSRKLVGVARNLL
jgi:hypothetical protein